MHELSLATGIVETVVKHAEGRRVTSVEMRIGTLRQVVPESLEFYFGICSRDTRLRGRDAGAGDHRGARCAAAACGERMGARRARLPLPSCAGYRRRGGRRHRVRGGLDRGDRGDSTTRRRRDASHQGEGRRGRARRKHDDRGGEPPRLRSRRRARGQPDVGPGRREDHPAGGDAPGARRARRRPRGRRAGVDGRRPDRASARPGRPAQHRRRLRRGVPPRREHGALGAAGDLDLRRASTCS